MGNDVTGTSFTDSTVVAGTVYEYQLIAQNTAGNSQPSQTATVPAGRSNITAYRPQHLHDPDNPTNAPIYFPYERAEVTELDEESLTVGPGIRINRDDDNDNDIVDRFEGGIPIPLENDLIEVRIDRLPGTGNLVLQAGDELQLYYTYDKEQPVPLDDDGILTEPLPFVNNAASVFVEWVTAGHGNDMLELVDPLTTMVIDTIVFHTFTSITIALGGFSQVPSVPTDPNHGVFVIADELYREGFDVLKFDEDEVAAGIGPGSPGEGIPYDEIENAVNNRFVTDVSIIGYSQGGGSTYNLSAWLDEQRQFGEIDPYNLVFTAYIDAVRDDGNLPEERRPVSSDWHLNLYQSANTVNNLVLDGASVAGSEEDINVEGPFFDLPDITHTTIDNHQEIIDWVLLRYRQNVVR